MGIVNFLCWAVVVGLFGSWLLTLADKWGVREWLEVHAPNEFLYQLFVCNFCCSWWVCVAICVFLLMVTGQFEMLAVPLISTTITRRFYENR